MSVNLHNRSLLELKDFPPRAIRYLLDLAAELKRSKAASTERPQLKGKHITFTREHPSKRFNFVRCSPEFHDHETELGRQIVKCFGLLALQLTNKVSKSDESIVFAQAENRSYTIKAVLVATLA